MSYPIISCTVPLPMDKTEIVTSQLLIKNEVWFI